MLTSAAEMLALQRAAELETPLAAVEAKLASLGAALRDNNSAAIESEAADLHRALASAVAHFGRAAREGGVPPPLRRRLAVAGGQVAAQREALARATAALDRAIDVLLPGMGSNVYAPSGTADRSASSPGSLLA
jgi:hypothetical protein